MTFTVSRKALIALGGVAVVVLAGVLGALIAGGGGDTTTVTVVETVEAEESVSSEDVAAEEAALEAEEAAEETDGAVGGCDDLGINREVGKEGRCDESGVTNVVVDKGSLLKLKELNARLLDIETAKAITGEYGDTKTANGVFVIFELEITNKTHAPTYFDASQEQAYLSLGENLYTEDFEAENYALDDSFLNLFEEIQPQTSSIGTIVFDVSKKVIPDLHKTGNLEILNFSDEGYAEKASEVGVFRTYK